MAKQSNIALDPFATGTQTRTTLYIPPIDGRLLPHAEQIAREVKRVKSARTEALANRPGKDDRDLDEVQLKIVSRVVESANLLRQFGESMMNDALARIRTHMPRALDTRLTMAGVDGDIAQAKLERREDLEHAGAQERLAQRHLNKFRRDHGLGERPAQYADTHLAPAAMLMLLTTIEAGANALLFQGVSEAGFVGGFFYALMFGVVNVGLGFLLGAGPLRLLGHFERWRRWLGALLGLIVLSVGMVWSLMIAGYRQQLVVDQSTRFTHSLSSPSGWLPISSPESWALCLLGIFILCLAARKGWGGPKGFWDSYIGYTNVDRIYHEARTANAGLIPILVQ